MSKEEINSMSNIAAIKAYFSPIEITMGDLKNLPKADRDELGVLAKAELSKEAVA